MFTFYARNINALPGQQNPPAGEVQLFTIPNQSDTDRPFLTASVSNELNNAGSFEFTVDPKSKFANIWRHMRSIIRIEYDGETIFYGRTLTVDRDLHRSRKIHCEGAYTFFMDSVFEGTKAGYDVNVSEYLQYLITAHNQCQENCPDKQIFLGEVPGNYSEGIDEIQKMPNDKQKYANTRGYKTVKDWLDELPSNYGGFMRVRYNQNDGKLYLDWMKMYFNKTINNQTMTVTRNAVDLSDTTEVENIFTHVLPTGDKWNYSDGTSGGGGSGGKHTITVNLQPKAVENFGAYAGAEPSSARKGDTVTLKAISPAFPDEKTRTKWIFSGWYVESGGVTVSGNSFEMGDQDVVITAVFGDEHIEHSAFTEHKITVNAENGWGNAWATKGSAVEGDIVYLNQQPYRGYKFKGWRSNVIVQFTGNSFVMPNKAVTITALYESKNPGVEPLPD